MQISVVGRDNAKQVFQVNAADVKGSNCPIPLKKSSLPRV